MNEMFKKGVRARRVQAWSGYYDHSVTIEDEKFQDNLPIVFKDDVENFASSAMRLLLTRLDEMLDGILSQFYIGDLEVDKSNCIVSGVPQFLIRNCR